MGCNESKMLENMNNGVYRNFSDNDKILPSPYPKLDIPRTDTWTFLKTRMLQFGDKLALIDYETNAKYTYAAVVESVETLAAHFQLAEMAPGVKVAYLARNSVNSLLSFMAVIATGATIVPITMAYSEAVDDFLGLAKITGCSFAMSGQHYKRQSLAFKKHFNDDCKGIYLINGLDPDFDCIEDLLHQKANKEYSRPLLNPKRDVSCVIFTSGTTGLPKAILHSHFSLVSECILVGRDSAICFFSESDTVLSWNPLVHVSGIVVNLASVAVGALLLVANSPQIDAERFVEICTKFKPTFFMAFPTALGRLVKQVNDNSDFSSVRTILLAGSSTPSILIEQIKARFSNIRSIINGYGMSECMGMISCTPLKQTDASNVGYPFSNCYIKVMDVNSDLMLDRGETGEIAFWSTSNMLGYMNNDAANAEIFDRTGFIRSGDIGYVDNQGRIFIVDRMKSMIKCMDYQVSPSELEEILFRHPAVFEVGVVGIPMEEYGEAPTACVVLQEEVTPSDELKDELKAMIQKDSHKSKYLYGGVYFMEKLPKTSTGKLARKELLQLLKDEYLNMENL